MSVKLKASFTAEVVLAKKKLKRERERERHRERSQNCKLPDV